MAVLFSCQLLKLPVREMRPSERKTTIFAEFVDSESFCVFGTLCRIHRPLVPRPHQGICERSRCSFHGCDLSSFSWPPSGERKRRRRVRVTLHTPAVSDRYTSSAVIESVSRKALLGRRRWLGTNLDLASILIFVQLHFIYNIDFSIALRLITLRN